MVVKWENEKKIRKGIERRLISRTDNLRIFLYRSINPNNFIPDRKVKKSLDFLLSQRYSPFDNLTN